MNSYLVSDDQQEVFEPLTGQWLNWQLVLELVWKRSQRHKAEIKRKTEINQQMGRFAVNRFEQFNPEERELLRVLLETHANAVSQIACLDDSVRVAAYLQKIEALELECRGQ